jgi:hypothetical protein
MYTRMEGLAHMGAGVGAVLYSALLLRLYGQLAIHGPFGRLLLVLGTAVGVKGLTWYLAPGPSILMTLYLFCFALFPLMAALFFEALLQRPLHLPAKLLLLLGTAFFCVTSLIPSFHAEGHWSGVALTIYMIATVVYLDAVTLVAWARQRPGPLRSLYGAMLIVALIAPLFMFSDIADLYLVDVPHMASVPMLLLVYYGGYALHLVGQWRMRLATLRLLGAAALLAVGVGAASLVEPMSAAQWASTCAMLLIGFIIIEPLRLVAVQQRVDRADLLFVRVSALPTASLDDFIAALTRWPELRVVQLIRTDDFAQVERARMARYFDVQGVVADRAVVRRQRLLTRGHQTLLAIEQLEHLMHVYEVDYLARIGPQPLLLGVRFDLGVDPATYKRLLSILAMLGQLLGDAGTHDAVHEGAPDGEVPE